MSELHDNLIKAYHAMVRQDWRIAGTPPDTPSLSPRTTMDDQEPTPTQQHLYEVWAGNLEMCGCGNPETAWNLIRDLLGLFATEEFGYHQQLHTMIGTEAAVHIVLSTLERARLIDHGSSIYGSWLTSKGKWMLWAMRQHEHDDLDHVGFPHDGEHTCTDACWTITSTVAAPPPAPAVEAAPPPVPVPAWHMEAMDWPSAIEPVPTPQRYVCIGGPHDGHTDVMWRIEIPQQMAMPWGVYAADHENQVAVLDGQGRLVYRHVSQP